MLKLFYPACFYPNDTGFTVIIPDLPGCVTEGKEITEAFEMAVDCASGWVLTELEDGNPIPKASDIQTITADEYPDGFTTMIVLDMDSYAEKYGEKSIRKNCTLPAWLNNRAEKMNINFSQVLQEALIQKLNI
ncbi:type II toxin-antitoxin system HicB family antitoxin [Ruminococcus sp. HUN007]|uniref:type II toxin-antitoxin system HicB family antitoxin n=1 Tax=Ruminococcus sp. HUN007 TaxID=1514668 RepID=UPI000AFC36B1|nr:type II toxin-antitoxin system HicB family antitoxin [Ruminococcus sp. HUN007]